MYLFMKLFVNVMDIETTTLTSNIIMKEKHDIKINTGV